MLIASRSMAVAGALADLINLPGLSARSWRGWRSTAPYRTIRQGPSWTSLESAIHPQLLYCHQVY